MLTTEFHWQIQFLARRPVTRKRNTDIYATRTQDAGKVSDIAMVTEIWRPWDSPASLYRPHAVTNHLRGRGSARARVWQTAIYLIGIYANYEYKSREITQRTHNDKHSIVQHFPNDLSTTIFKNKKYKMY